MLAPGTPLGRYTVRTPLGAGGMGEVYAAFDPELERVVALKVLPSDLAGDARRVARFVREAKAASALNHPNIVTVLDAGTHGDMRFLVTELVDGWTLRQWLAHERPDLQRIIDVCAQTASALAAAHEAGIVHRDIKPENVMLRRDGFVKVLDFGIAKLLVETPSEPDEGDRATMPGTVLGTTRYMSPEQARGTAVDARSDVWSLGVLLYELIAGQPPFSAPTPMGTVALIVGREPVPLEAAAPSTPRAVCDIVERALRKQPSERFDTAKEMAAELARVARGLNPAIGRRIELDDIATQHFDRQPTERTRPLSRPTNLPPRASSLIGRARELRDVCALLRDDDVRLVTLTGPGGSGKTRLAVEAGRMLLGDFDGGVFAVDLSALTDSERIAEHIAAELGLEASHERTLADELERHLADKRMLLVLDNFEHLLAGATTVARLLAAASGLTVLVTSRAALHLQREREYAVEPLEVPAFTSLPSLDELANTPAVALFVERASAARPSFALTPDNARVVVEICRRLDGLPLALELAAARVRLLSPHAMLERLDQRLKLLTGGARDLPSRQQTMRGALGWSYDLLEPGERTVLRRLAVFAGGWMLDAAEAVCVVDGVDVLDGIESLVDKNLIRQRELEDGDVRFTMLAVVREFAFEQIEANDEAEGARNAHAEHYARLAERAAPVLWGPEQAVWVERLRRDFDNLVAAISFLIERAPAQGTALVLNLSTLFQVVGAYSLRRTWLLRALGTEPAPEIRAKLLHGLSNCELRLGNFPAAADYARHAVEATREHGQRRALGLALNALGQALLKNGDSEGARRAHEEGLAIARELGDGSVASLFLNSLGELERNTGNLDAARADYEQALEETGRDSRWNITSITLLNLGGVAFGQGDVESADRYFRDSLSIAAELGSKDLAADAIDGLGAIAFTRAKLERSARLAAAAEVLYELVGVSREPPEQMLRDRYVAALRTSLDAAAFEREWARGRAMSLEDAASEALASG